MASWKATLAIVAAGALMAGPAFAQGTTSSSSSGTTAPSKDAGQMPKSGDTMKSGSSDTMKSDTGMKSGHKGGMAKGSDKVKAVQQALKDKGHDPGDVDGKMGPKTHAALRDFQKAQGMQATGRLDGKTMQALGVEGTTTGSAGPSSTSGSASPSTGSSSAPSSSTSDTTKGTSGATKK